MNRYTYRYKYIQDGVTIASSFKDIGKWAEVVINNIRYKIVKSSVRYKHKYCIVEVHISPMESPI